MRRGTNEDAVGEGNSYMSFHFCCWLSVLFLWNGEGEGVTVPEGVAKPWRCGADGGGLRELTGLF